MVRFERHKRAFLAGAIQKDAMAAILPSIQTSPSPYFTIFAPLSEIV
jgi:hypothetical protein